jgi:hypothetical protein
MLSRQILRNAIVALVVIAAIRVNAAPPFHGTIFISPDIIKPSDPSTFIDAKYVGRQTRRMFDRRNEKWNKAKAFLFNARFERSRDIEIQVNAEFESEAAAQVEADKYGRVVGQLPKALQEKVETVSIHRGTKPFGGGNRNLLIHTGQAEKYEADGILEEALVHEACHTSLDARHAKAKDWLKAQQADPEFISKYAAEHPTREDIAESFVPYLAVRHRADRISEELAGTIKRVIVHRIEYFDAQLFDLYPIGAERKASRGGETNEEED